MKALTVLQPWATLIITGAKPYEFRSWRPHAKLVGERIVIHAAKRELMQTEVAHLLCLLRDGQDEGEKADTAVESCLNADKALPVLQRAWAPSYDPLRTQAGVGTAIIGEPRLAQEIAEELGVPRVNDSDRDQHAFWAWPMLDPPLWLAPIPMRGAQGFWTWPEPDDAIGRHPVSRPAKCKSATSQTNSLESTLDV